MKNENSQYGIPGKGKAARQSGFLKVGDDIMHITELDEPTLTKEWSKLVRELDDVYSINHRNNTGWRGLVLRLMGIHLPDGKRIRLLGKNARGEAIYGGIENKCML